MQRLVTVANSSALEARLESIWEAFVCPDVAWPAVGRGRANWVNIRYTEAPDVVYQVNMDLSQWLGLRGAVNI